MKDYAKEGWIKIIVDNGAIKDGPQIHPSQEYWTKNNHWVKIPKLGVKHRE